MSDERDPFEELEELHARFVRIHGRARAESARWRALTRLAIDLYERMRAEKEAALLRALAELEAARRWEEKEIGWARNAEWCARRIDMTDASRARATRLYTRIDFNTGEELEELVPTDLDEGDIEW